MAQETINNDGTGMIIFTKRMSGGNRIQWPRNKGDPKKITYEQLNQLLSGMYYNSFTYWFIRLE